MRIFEGLMATLLLGVTMPAAAQERLGQGDADKQDFDENALPRKLPKLPQGMSIDMINRGGELFRGKGGCQTCHGQFGEGLPNLGKSLVSGLAYTPAQWSSIDSLIKSGIPEALSRTTSPMPPRGAAQNLTDEETRLVAAYVWAIGQVQGEPWEGGRRKAASRARGSTGT